MHEREIKTAVEKKINNGKMHKYTLCFFLIKNSGCAILKSKKVKMMNLVEKISSDMVIAMKSQDKGRLTVLRMIKAAMQMEHIDKKRELNDELAIDIINKQVKMRQDSIMEFQKGNRADLVEKTNGELAILKEYLPKPLNEEEVLAIIDEAFQMIQPVDSKDMGKIMKEVTPKLKGRSDMGRVSQIIKEKLN